MKQNLQISINPTYKCNFHCDFCYLQGLFSNDYLNPNKLDEILKNLSQRYNISFIDLYGGEITTLPDSIVQQYLRIIFKYVPTISIILNGSRFPDYLKDDRIEISVSWDYKYRPLNQEVLDNIWKFRKQSNMKEVDILLTSPLLYKEDLSFLDKLDGICRNFELKCCMKTNSNHQNLQFRDFLNAQILWSNKALNNSHFINNDYLDGIFPKKEKHIFINPKGELVDIVYKNNIESFEELKIDEKFVPDKQCLTCKFYKKCFNEHPGYYIYDDYDCVGQFKFLDFIHNLKSTYINQTTFEDFQKIRNLNYSYNDNLSKEIIYEKTDEETFLKFLKYFENENEEISYPSKTYFVAYLYAYLISLVTKETIPYLLSLKDFLPFDPCFSNQNALRFYLKNRVKIPHVIDFNCGMQRIVKKIFDEEFKV